MWFSGYLRLIGEACDGVTNGKTELTILHTIEHTCQTQIQGLSSFNTYCSSSLLTFNSSLIAKLLCRVPRSKPTISESWSGRDSEVATGNNHHTWVNTLEAHRATVSMVVRRLLASCVFLAWSTDFCELAFSTASRSALCFIHSLPTMTLALFVESIVILCTFAGC